ncbi:amidohydrolase [Schlesneria paludicola]|uniref:amidohydrolase n=1 Tax=Schlesneria paludicola TaxID=360056 RepID=UPI00029B4445|nr:amidohydrolase [Schlesneria paludicola]
MLRCVAVLLCMLLLSESVFAQKEKLSESIVRREASSWDLALKIWALAEPGYQEIESARLLADVLEQAGFQVKRGVAEIPTAFTATFGSGSPVIAILGEYDALPGLSQEATTERMPRPSGTYGHACGHHLFGVASASAAIALAEQIAAKQLTGTVRFYGCPAEEGGSGKAFMVRAGLFHDCDAALHWHPSSRNTAGDSSCLARAAVKFRFHGLSAHAAGSPELGRSALDAIELTCHASELMREHTPDLTRIHHVITSGGGAPNVVPDFAEVFFYVRHPKAEIVRELYPRLVKCAQAGALATETKLEEQYLGGTMELLPNDRLAEIALANLKQLNDLKYDATQAQFAQRISETLARPQPLDSIAQVSDTSGEVGKGSTDVGDVSWVIPTAGFTTACFVPGTASHSWQAVAAGGTTIGKQGMQLAARTMAATVWDLLKQPEIVTQAKAEHARRLAGRKYEPLILPNQKAPLDYRRVLENQP